MQKVKSVQGLYNFTKTPTRCHMRGREHENIKGHDQLPDMSNWGWGTGLALTHEIVMTLDALSLEGKHRASVWDFISSIKDTIV